MKVALYKSLDFGFESVAGPELENSDTFVRVSEFTDITFPPLRGNDQVQRAVAVLDRMRAKTVTEYHDKLAEIERKRSELLALTHQPVAP